MIKGKKDINYYTRIFFGVGRAVTILQCMLGILFFYYIKELAIPAYITATVFVLALVIPLVIFPFIYHIINSSMAIATGKYHLPLAICAIVCSFSTALLFSLETVTPLGQQVTTIFFTLLFTILSLLVFMSVYASMERRLITSKNSKFFIAKNIFSALGGIAFCICMYSIFDFSLESISKIGYVVSAVLLLCVFVVYMSTFMHMPKFIRVEAARIRNLKEKYKVFFGSFSDDKNLQSYIEHFLLSSGLAIFALASITLLSVFKLDKMVLVTVLLVFSLVCYTIVMLFTKKINATNTLFYKSIVLATVVISAVMFVIGSFVDFSSIVSNIFGFGVAVVLGIGAGIVVVCVRIRRAMILVNTTSSPGIIGNIFYMITILALGVSLIVVSISDLAGKYMPLVSMICAVLFFTASVIMQCLKARKKVQKTLDDNDSDVDNSSILEQEDSDSKQDIDVNQDIDLSELSDKDISILQENEINIDSDTDIENNDNFGDDQEVEIDEDIEEMILVSDIEEEELTDEEFDELDKNLEQEFSLNTMDKEESEDDL